MKAKAINNRADALGVSGAARRSVTAAIAVCILLVLASSTQGADATGVESESKRVVVLGDSLAAGLGVERDQAYPALLQKKIAVQGWNFTVVNAGISGDTSADGLARVDWLLKQKVDVLILELGGNDGLRGVPVSVTRTNLQAIIDRVKRKYPQAQIIVAGMQMPPNLGEEYTTAFRELFPELAKKNHATLIPFLLEGVAGKPGLTQEDHIHPTAEGQKIVAKNVWQVLKPILEKLNSADASPKRRSGDTEARESFLTAWIQRFGFSVFPWEAKRGVGCVPGRGRRLLFSWLRADSATFPALALLLW